MKQIKLFSSTYIVFMTYSGTKKYVQPKNSTEPEREEFLNHTWNLLQEKELNKYANYGKLLILYQLIHLIKVKI